jgi:Pvc16 N-terminal domain
VAPLPSSLSLACRSMADFLAERLGTTDEAVLVTLGTPKDAVDSGSDSGHRLNLFFYRIEPGGFGPHPGPDQPWPLRVHCLVTAFSVAEDNVSSGENDLRILGEVVRIFHEHPVLAPVGVNGTTVRLHAVFQPLGLDDLNHIWSTQGDVTLRPSVAYELSLAPIVPRVASHPAPLAGGLGLAVGPLTEAGDPPLPETAALLEPEVAATRVDVRRGDWVPHVCWVIGGSCRYALTLPLGSAALQALQPLVWIAGVPGEQVTLRWETWSAAGGWRPGPSAAAPVGGPAIDPNAAATAPTTAVTLPFEDRAGQATLHAERTWTRPDGAPVTLRSNPLLVTLHEEEP